jgi:hypothetical protein
MQACYRTAKASDWDGAAASYFRDSNPKLGHNTADCCFV